MSYLEKNPGKKFSETFFFKNVNNLNVKSTRTLTRLVFRRVAFEPSDKRLVFMLFRTLFLTFVRKRNAVGHSPLVTFQLFFCVPLSVVTVKNVEIHRKRRSTITAVCVYDVRDAVIGRRRGGTDQSWFFFFFFFFFLKMPEKYFFVLH